MHDGGAPHVQRTLSQPLSSLHICKIPATISGCLRRKAAAGRHYHALLRAQTGLVDVFCKSRNNNLWDLRNDAARPRLTSRDTCLRFQTDDPQDFQSARAAAGKDQLDLRAKLLHQLIDHV
jgi:hypothetical protein